MLALENESLLFFFSCRNLKSLTGREVREWSSMLWTWCDGLLLVQGGMLQGKSCSAGLSPRYWSLSRTAAPRSGKSPSVMPPSVFQRVGSQWLNWAGHWQANWWEKKGEEKEGRERAGKGQQPRKEKAAFIKDCSDSREVPLRLFYENCEGKGLEK